MYLTCHLQSRAPISLYIICCYCSNIPSPMIRIMRIYLFHHKAAWRLLPTSWALGEPTFTSHKSSICMKWCQCLEHLDCIPDQPPPNRNTCKTKPPGFAILYFLAGWSSATHLASQSPRCPICITPCWSKDDRENVPGCSSTKPGTRRNSQDLSFSFHNSRREAVTVR